MVRHRAQGETPTGTNTIYETGCGCLKNKSPSFEIDQKTTSKAENGISLKQNDIRIYNRTRIRKSDHRTKPKPPMPTDIRITKVIRETDVGLLVIEVRLN